MTDRPMHTVPGAFQKLQQLYAEGEHAMTVGDLDGAVAKFTEGLSIDDHFRQRYVTMYAQRAFAYLHQQNWAGAAADLTRAIELEPEPHQANYLFQRARCHHALNDLAAAMADLDRATALAPEFWMPHDLRGRIHLAAGRDTEAVVAFDRVMSLAPNEKTKALLEQARAGQVSAAHSAQAAVASGPAGEEDPVVFPGARVARLSDYVAIMKKMQTGDMMGALSAYGLDMMAYGAVAAQWANKLGADPVLNAKFVKRLGGG